MTTKCSFTKCRQATAAHAVEAKDAYQVVVGCWLANTKIVLQRRNKIKNNLHVGCDLELSAVQSSGKSA